MSTLSLPPYSADGFQAPLYSPAPDPLCEAGFYRVPSLPSTTVVPATPRPPAGEFVKESKGANLRLRLYRQSDNATVPVFGIRGPVVGTLELSKPKGLVFVAVRVRLPQFSLSLSLSLIFRGPVESQFEIKIINFFFGMDDQKNLKKI